MLPASGCSGKLQTLFCEANDVSRVKAAGGVLVDGVCVGYFDDQEATRGKPVAKILQGCQRVWQMFEDVKEGYHVEGVFRTGEVEDALGFNLDSIALAREFSVEGIGFNAADAMPGLLQDGEPFSRTGADVENF